MVDFGKISKPEIRDGWEPTDVPISGTWESETDGPCGSAGGECENAGKNNLSKNPFKIEIHEQINKI